MEQLDLPAPDPALRMPAAEGPRALAASATRARRMPGLDIGVSVATFNPAMEIMFDPAKRAATLADRGLDFAEAPKVFAGPTFTFADLRFDYPEERFVTIGLLEGRMVQVVWTPASNGRRIISMRKTNDRESKRFGQRLG